jgi:hypothetical protein
MAPIQVLDTSGYVSPGGTGTISTTGDSGSTGGTTTTGTFSLADGPISNCDSQSALVTVIGSDPSGCTTTVTTLPDFDTLIDGEPTGQSYTQYTAKPIYDTDYHTIQMPVASSTVTDASFAVVAQPTAKLNVTWVAEMIGDWPDVPAADSNDQNKVLLSKRILGQNVEVMGDQNTIVYTIQGEYIYGFVSVTAMNLYMGTSPYLQTSLADTEIPDSSFVQDLI